METDESKEKHAVSKAESAGKEVSAKARNFGQGGHKFHFGERMQARKHHQL